MEKTNEQPAAPIDCRRCVRYQYCRIAAILPMLDKMFVAENCTGYKERKV